jgi:hypothetical protein
MDNVKTGKVKNITTGDGITSSARSFYIDNHKCLGNGSQSG